MAGTVQLMDEPVCLDDRGFRNVTATQRFGDFSIATISEQIRPLLDRKREGGILAGGERSDTPQEPVPDLVRPTATVSFSGTSGADERYARGIHAYRVLYPAR